MCPRRRLEFTIWTARSHGRARQGKRANCQRGRNLTMTMAIQYHLSMFSSAAAGVMNAAHFSYFLALARRMTECQPTKIRPFPLHMYRAYAPTPTPTPLQPRHSGTGIKLSERENQGRHLRPEIQRRMDNRNEATALRVPLGDFEHNNCLKLCPETNTSLWPQLNVLRGTNIHAKMFK